MAVSKMKMMKIIGQYERLDEAIDVYAQSGCYHPERTSDIMAGIGGFVGVSEENPYKQAMTGISDMFSELGVNPDSVGEPQEKPSPEELSRRLDEVQKNIGALRKQRNALLHEIEYIENSLEQLGHFRGMDIDIDRIFQSKFINVRFGRLPAESFNRLSEYVDNPYVMFFPYSHDSDYYWGMYVAPVNSKEEVDRIFSSMFFERLRIPNAVGTPDGGIELLEEQMCSTKEALEEIDASVGEYLEREHRSIMSLYAQIKWQYETFELRRYSARYSNSFMQVGWVPEREVDKLSKKLSDIEGLEFSVEDPGPTDGVSPPTKLRNPRIFRPFEYFVELYGLPNYKEVDPTVFVALTYILFFGVMFADLGQGIILSLVGLYMWKSRGMPLGKILVPCGISSALFGIVFGSVFGFEEVLDPLYRLIGLEGRPVHVMESAMTLLLLSIGLGILLIICAMLINIYASIKSGKIGRALFSPNGVCGIMIFGGIVAIALGMVMGIEGIPTKLIVIVCVIIPLALLFFGGPLSKLIEGKKDWKPEKWGEYLLESFFELFETLLSYVTNTVSFMRVGAFVLVHAGMMLVFFSLAELVGGGVAGAVVIVLGNILVIALEGLLVGVQALRLEFYEMFSRFFEGDGRAFVPIKIAINRKIKK